MASPTLSSPQVRAMPAGLVPWISVPSSLEEDVIAPSGQTISHPRQEWHISGKVRTFLPIMVMAENWHIFSHSLQRVHFSMSTLGIMVDTGLFTRFPGFKKMWELGSSTSQSKTSTSPAGADAARFTVMVVLPVPPFPLAMVIIIMVSFMVPKSVVSICSKV